MLRYFLGIGVTKAANVTEVDDPFLRPTTSDVFADLILNIFPDNIVAMCIRQVRHNFNSEISLADKDVLYLQRRIKFH